MLNQRFPAQTLQQILKSRESWRPFPLAADREAWKALPDPVRQAYIGFGEASLGYRWPELQAVRFLDFARNGNRSRFEAPSFERRSTLAGLVMAECIEGMGRFVDDIVNGVWAICEESYWGVPAHVGIQQAGQGLPDTAEPTVDLFAAETASLLAWTSYLLGPQLDAVSPLILPRIQREVECRMLEPCFARDDFWWMGFQQRAGLQRVNNWNPWICSNWLATALLLEQDSERRLATVAKIMTSLDFFIDPYPQDGGCDEGPSYWGRAGASLFDCLELLYSATDGQINVYDNPLIQNMGRFIYRVQIHDDYYINFADAPAIVRPTPHIVFKYGQRIGDEQMMALGAWLARREGLFAQGFSNVVGKRLESIGRQLPTLFTLDEMKSVEPAAPLPQAVWLDEIEVLVARDQSGSSDGLFVAAKGGHNGESHNHNDIGNFVVHIDGKPVLIDAGVEVYTAKTFGPQRYEIWTMQSGYHNLPTIGGVMQAPGDTYAARDVRYTEGAATSELSLDIAGAYPSEAGVKSWRRTFTLYRGQNIQVADSYDLSAPVQDLTLNLITPCEVKVNNEGQIVLNARPLPGDREAGEATLTYDPYKFTLATETISITDARLQPVWGDRLTRIILQVGQPPQQARWLLRISP